MADHTFFDTPFVAMAHRGGSLLPANMGKENTMAAFQNAVDLGYRHLETDIHLTADGHVVAFHDEHLERVSEATGPIRSLTLAEVRDVRVGGEPVPTLAELFEAFPDARFNIDIKAPGAEEPLARLLNWHRARNRVCVASFSQRRLRRFRKLAGPGVATSCGPLETAWMIRDVGLNRVLPAGPGVALQVPLHHTIAGRRVVIVTERFIARAHRSGRLVHVWTIDDAPTMHRLMDLGVDGLVSDAIDVLKEVLLERGLWAGATTA